MTGSMTVYVTKEALVSPGLPKWHLPGRTDGYSRTAGSRLFTMCGRAIATWPDDGSRSVWHAVAIRRLFAGTFAIPCGTCKRADLAQKRGRR